MFNGKSFNEKFLLTRKYHDFARAINCTRKLTCVCAYACACDRTRLREQYVKRDYALLPLVISFFSSYLDEPNSENLVITPKF